MPMRVANKTPLKGERLVIVIEEAGRMTANGRTVKIGGQIAKLLVHLADRSPRVCTQEQIMVAVSPDIRDTDDIDISLIKVLVSKARKTLEVLTDMMVIETVRGVGYRIPNYVEIRTNINSGERISVPDDVFAMLVNLAFEANKSLDAVVRECLIEGGKIVQHKVMKEIAERDGDINELLDDPWK